MGNRHKLKVRLSEATKLTDLDAATWPVAAMTGTASVKFGADELAALRSYLLAGGTLLVDAGGGSKAFAASIEAQLGGLLPGGSFEVIPSDHALYTKAGPAIEKVRYRKALRTTLAEPTNPRLRGVTHNGRLVIIFSPDDLTAGLVRYSRWELRGYEPLSSFELARNALLYASDTTLTK